MQTDIEMIEQLHEKDRAASKTRNLAALVSLCTDDCVMLPPGEDPIIGKEAIRSWLERDLFEEVKILGEWAFEWGTFSAAAKPVGEGQPIKTTGKLFRILKRRPSGAWKVARSIWNND